MFDQDNLVAVFDFEARRFIFSLGFLYHC
jgi:hypothetical protein